MKQARSRLTRDCKGSTQLETVFLGSVAIAIALAVVVPLGTVAGGRFVENGSGTVIRQRAPVSSASSLDNADAPMAQPFAMRQREQNTEEVRQWLDENVAPLLESALFRPAKRLLWFASTLIPLDKVRAYAEWRSIDSDEMEAYERYRAPIEAALSIAKDAFVEGVSTVVTDFRNDWRQAIDSRATAMITPWSEAPAETAMALVAAPFVTLLSRGSDWGSFLWAEDDAVSAQAAARLGPGVVAEFGAGALSSVSALAITKKVGSIRQARRAAAAADAERLMLISPEMRLFKPARDWAAFRSFLNTNPHAAASSLPIGWHWSVFAQDAQRHARLKEMPPDLLFLRRAVDGQQERVVGAVLVREGHGRHGLDGRIHEYQPRQITWLAGEDIHTRASLVYQALHLSRLGRDEKLQVRPVRGNEILFTREGFIRSEQEGIFEVIARPAD